MPYSVNDSPIARDYAALTSRYNETAASISSYNSRNYAGSTNPPSRGDYAALNHAVSDYRAAETAFNNKYCGSNFFKRP